MNLRQFVARDAGGIDAPGVIRWVFGTRRAGLVTDIASGASRVTRRQHLDAAGGWRR